jgi:hypothetical protein
MKALGKGSIASWVRIGLLVAWWVMWFSAVCLVAFAVGYVALLLLVQNGIIDPQVLTGGEGQVRLGDADGSSFNISYDEPGGLTWPVVLPGILIAGVAVGGSLIIIWRLRKLFESFTSGEPFRRENAQHLRVIWITMVVIEVSRWILAALTAVLVVQFSNVEHISIEPEGDPLTTWMAIFVLICLAEVFREGARLKEEQELTI